MQNADFVSDNTWTRRSGDQIDDSRTPAACSGAVHEQVAAALGADIVRLARLATSIHLAESARRIVSTTTQRATVLHGAGFATAERTR